MRLGVLVCCALTAMCLPAMAAMPAFMVRRDWGCSEYWS